MTTLRAAWRGGRNGRPGWYLVTGYDEALVEALKALPQPDRAWDPEQHDGAGAWWVSELWQDKLVTLIGGFEAFLRQAPLF